MLTNTNQRQSHRLNKSINQRAKLIAYHMQEIKKLESLINK